MTFTSEQKQFIENMEIDEAEFIKLDRDIQILIDIAEDYERHKNDLLDESAYIANKLQRCKAVHSVRSRVKDTSHLIEKIIRKWSEETVSEKYDTISKDNYKSVITDLIGVRAIYLFKNDWSTVHDHILSKWTLKEDEKVVIYYRNGDDRSLYNNYNDCNQKIHNSGYRSIHYIVPATKIDGQQLYCEIQTRTIFEEGWSEIDHKVRYPSFLDDPDLQQYLNIFNRLAGSADEMGSYVHSLVTLIETKSNLEQIHKEFQNKILNLEAKAKASEEKIERLLTTKAKLEDVQKEFEELKKINKKTSEIRFKNEGLNRIKFLNNSDWESDLNKYFHKEFSKKIVINDREKFENFLRMLTKDDDKKNE